LYLRHSGIANVKILLARVRRPILSSQPFIPSWANSLYMTSMHTSLRKYQGTSSAYSAAGQAIARELCVAVDFPVNPGMVDTK